MQFFEHCFDNLTEASQPSAQRLGPVTSAMALRRRDDVSAIAAKPSPVSLLPQEAFLGDVRSLGWYTDTEQTRVGTAAQGKKLSAKG